MDMPRSRKIAVRILHLYHDLMNLYGDWANADVLVREFAARGRAAEVDKKSVGDDVNFITYDFIYIGSGTERSQRACMHDMMRHKGAFIMYIEEGKHVLATGNSHELFGHAVSGVSGGKYEALGLLDFETIQQDSRVTGDCVSKVSFLQDRLIGFINRAGHGQEGKIERPFTNELGPGANDKSCTEGIRYKNLLGTYLTGPILVRNPPLLKYIADSLTGPAERADDPFFVFQEEAYRMALTELTARIE